MGRHPSKGTPGIVWARWALKPSPRLVRMLGELLPVFAEHIRGCWKPLLKRGWVAMDEQFQYFGSAPLYPFLIVIFA